MNIKDLTGFDYILARNPIDMAEGGDVHDNSTRLKYLFTARKMLQPAEPTPLNKTAMTSKRGIMFGGVPFRKPGKARVMDQYFYDGLLGIEDQTQAEQARAFATSGTPKDTTNF